MRQLTNEEMKQLPGLIDRYGSMEKAVRHIMVARQHRHQEYEWHGHNESYRETVDTWIEIYEE